MGTPSRPPGARYASSLCPRPTSRPKPAHKPERAAVVTSPQPVCAVCPAPRPVGRRETCSDRCRAELSRRRRKDALQARDDEIRALLATALRKLEEGAP